ncbi:nucleotidyltransferase [Paenibacillus sp. MMS20-IR301]|uniref:nucleotidyltransferase n=1 Tax=Paenibacillus sp. MMS20-IR301 TaxID=2895946 RepID=UPI0028E68DC6|nr:nucleotidyltransferase [Paenibacillus sp. MMS20-IR301]WNS46296.1 nucleotidyltransferase [Paenibacillus sp. MMS20-IR301]
MEASVHAELQSRYTAAAESFVDKVKGDPNVIAVIVCGSLAYDQVWERSDIDMAVIVRDQLLQQHGYCLVEDGITINVQLFARSEFKRGFEKMVGGSIPQSYFAKGQIVYSADDSLYEYFEEFKKLGSHDIALSLLRDACELIDLFDKSRKWLTVRKDLLYAQYYLLKAADQIAKMELSSQGEPPIRESILTVMDRKPELMAPLYSEAMSRRMSQEDIGTAIGGISRFIDGKLDMLKEPVLDYLADGEIRTMTMLAKHFKLDTHLLINILEYLADKGIIEKVSQTIRITPKSRPAVEEIGYLYIP